MKYDVSNRPGLRRLHIAEFWQFLWICQSFRKTDKLSYKYINNKSMRQVADIRSLTPGSLVFLRFSWLLRKCSITDDSINTNCIQITLFSKLLYNKLITDGLETAAGYYIMLQCGRSTRSGEPLCFFQLWLRPKDGDKNYTNTQCHGILGSLTWFPTPTLNSSNQYRSVPLAGVTTLGAAQRAINQGYIQFTKRIDLLAIPNHADVPGVWLVGPSKFSVLSSALFCIEDKFLSRSITDAMCKLTTSATYKPLTPVMVTGVTGPLIRGLTFKTWPKKDQCDVRITRKCGTLWTHGVRRNGIFAVLSVDLLAFFVLLGREDVEECIDALNAIGWHDNAKTM